MANKEKSIDAPGYDPNLKHVPFPPTPEDYERAKAAGDSETAEGGPTAGDGAKAAGKQPYYENYTPDAPAPDPSQTAPGATDIRDPHARLAEGETTEKMSPDVNLNLREPGDFDK